VGQAALLSSSGASRRRRHRQRERGRHTFAPALTFAMTFYSAVDTGHPCHAALVSSVNPLFLSVATAACRVVALRARNCHPARVSARKRRRLVSFTCVLCDAGQGGGATKLTASAEATATSFACGRRRQFHSAHNAPALYTCPSAAAAALTLGTLLPRLLQSQWKCAVIAHNAGRGGCWPALNGGLEGCDGISLNGLEVLDCEAD
jgi:hypothetical protein